MSAQLTSSGQGHAAPSPGGATTRRLGATRWCAGTRLGGNHDESRLTPISVIAEDAIELRSVAADRIRLRAAGGDTGKHRRRETSLSPSSVDASRNALDERPVRRGAGRPSSNEAA
jgi:hypothetical protein